MRDLKYFCELDFQYGSKPIRFTAVDLERMLARFNKEVLAEQQRKRDERDYVYVEPQLRLHVTHSWADFDKYER